MTEAFIPSTLLDINGIATSDIQTCCGLTLRGQRCQNPINQVNRLVTLECFRHLEHLLSSLVISNAKIKEELTCLAQAALCQLDHQDQSHGMRNRWNDSIIDWLMHSPYVETRQENGILSFQRTEWPYYTLAGQQHETNQSNLPLVDKHDAAMVSTTGNDALQETTLGQDQCTKCERLWAIEQRELKVSWWESEMAKSEVELRKKRTEIKAMVEGLRKRIGELIAKDQELTREEEDIHSRELRVRKREEAAESRGKSLQKREENVQRKEEELRFKGRQVQSRETRLTRMDQAIRLADDTSRERELAVTRKEEVVSSKEAEVQRREVQMTRREEAVRSRAQAVWNAQENLRQTQPTEVPRLGEQWRQRRLNWNSSYQVESAWMTHRAQAIAHLAHVRPPRAGIDQPTTPPEQPQTASSPNPSPTSTIPALIHQPCTTIHIPRRTPLMGDECAICLGQLLDGTPLLWCKTQCGNNVHKLCWDGVFAAAVETIEVARCVYCRSVWGPPCEHDDGA